MHLVTSLNSVTGKFWFPCGNMMSFFRQETFYVTGTCSRTKRVLDLCLKICDFVISKKVSEFL